MKYDSVAPETFDKDPLIKMTILNSYVILDNETGSIKDRPNIK
jgi:hypothetical protein